ncbi:MAG: SpaH/EbpB family LPXTG-anchored major pilin [Lachnospiraceae bacterium]|nr:SpaH/EbpB family LPXTG-anchored major pilin [Lachnospiraceae bacterium]
MKTTKFKKFMALLLTGMMTLSMFSGVALADDSQPEYVGTDAYVLNYAGADAKPYQYGSRYSFDHSYNDPAAGPNSVWSYNNCPEVFNLVNTLGGANVGAYCTDADTSARDNKVYRRINLEDSTYHTPGAAARLRAVILNSFPHISVEDVAKAANAAGYPVTDLAQGELLSATQQAIWEITHGDKYTVNDHYDGIRGMYSYDEDDFVYPDSLDAVETEYTESNMINLYNYFLNMEGIEAEDIVVSDASFVKTEREVVVVKNDATGEYEQFTVINAVIEIQKSEGDEMKLSAVVGENVVDTKELPNGTTKYELTLPGVVDKVDLYIDGQQNVSGVYLFDAEGDRTVSQSMVGYVEGFMPIHAQTSVTPDRVININKTTKIGDVMYPLEGIVFDIYYVGTVDEYTAQESYFATKVDDKMVPTEAAIAAITGNAPVTTLTTDITGKASVNLSKLNGVENPDGIYMLVERPHAAIEAPLAPFYVAVPMTTEDGSGLSYTINVSAKNDIKDGPEIKKDVTEIENNLDSFEVNEEHTWIIRGGVPVDMADGKEYIIRDTLDYRLTYAEDLAVKVGLVTDKANTEAVELEINKHYIVITSQATVKVGEGETAVEEVVDKFEVRLTEAGMDKVATSIAEGKTNADYEVRVYFNAVIDEDASAGVLIPNKATLDYTNSVNFEFDSESDIPQVFTCAINIFKHDAKDAKVALSGATFKLAKVVADKNVTGAVQLVTEKSKTAWVVYEEFYNSAVIAVDDPATADVNEATAKVNFVETDAEGKAMLYGLAAGEYYLVETKAPAGYNLLSYPIKVTVGTAVNADQEVELSEANAIYEVKVANSNTFVLPETGGIGTVIFTVSGGLMTLAGGAILTLKKREEE